MIDLGLAKRFKDPRTDQHIQFKESRGLVGTPKYISLNGHLGHEQSRRDDLESLGNILVYFMKQGKLPWDLKRKPLGQVDMKDPKALQNQLLLEKEEQKHNHDVTQKKKNTSVKELCKGLPDQFETYLGYCRNLEFDKKPDYKYLRNLFDQLSKDLSFEDDQRLDWILHKEKLLEMRKKKEEEDRRTQQMKKQKQQGKLGARLAMRMAAIEEEERKRKEEEKERIEAELAKKASQVKQQDKAVIQQKKQEELRAMREEMHEKLRTRIDEIIKFEEENANKKPQADNEEDEFKFEEEIQQVNLLVADNQKDEQLVTEESFREKQPVKKAITKETK